MTMHNRTLTAFQVMPLIPGHEAELAGTIRWTQSPW